MKMNDLNLSDFRELRIERLLHCIFCSYGRWCRCLFKGNLQFSSQGFGCANFKADTSYISHLRNFIALTGS